MTTEYSSDPPSSSAPTFTVTGQQRIPDPSDPSGQSDTWRVEYKTAGGTVDWVVVPQRDYTAEKVAELIRDRYDQIVGVERLTGA